METLPLRLLSVLTADADLLGAVSICIQTTSQTQHELVARSNTYACIAGLNGAAMAVRAVQEQHEWVARSTVFKLHCSVVCTHNTSRRAYLFTLLWCHLDHQRQVEVHCSLCACAGLACSLQSRGSLSVHLAGMVRRSSALQTASELLALVSILRAGEHLQQTYSHTVRHRKWPVEAALDSAPGKEVFLCAGVVCEVLASARTCSPSSVCVSVSLALPDDWSASSTRLSCSVVSCSEAPELAGCAVSCHSHWPSLPSVSTGIASCRAHRKEQEAQRGLHLP